MPAQGLLCPACLKYCNDAADHDDEWFLLHDDCWNKYSENGSKQPAREIPQGPTFNPAKSGSPDQAKSHSQKAEKSYTDVVRDNRSTHSIELIN